MSSTLIGFGRVVIVMCVVSTVGFGVTSRAISTNDPPVQSGGDAEAGRRLFDRNCAHCHGDDARGDEGPSLYDVRKSDERIAKIIKGGIKGEMPAFGKKLTDTNVQSLLAYLRTLKD